jgi:hypothetical protein
MISAVRASRPAVRVFGINVAGLTVLRAIFYVLFSDHRLPSSDILHAFYLDLFDPARAEKSAAFVFTTFRQPPNLGLVRGSRYGMVKAGETETLPEAFYELSRWLLIDKAARARVLYH